MSQVTLDPKRPTAPILLHKGSDGDRIHLRYQVPKDLAYFAGHFHKVAVVAGVVQLKWVRDAIAEHGGTILKMTGMEAVKFHQILLPEQEFEMTLRHDQERRKWAYHIVSEGRKIASGRFLEQH